MGSVRNSQESDGRKFGGLIKALGSDTEAWIVTDKAYRIWADVPGYQTSLRSVFSGSFRLHHHDEAWESRRLQWEYNTMFFPFPVLLLEALRYISAVFSGHWVTIRPMTETPDEDAAAWSAQSSLGIQEAIRLIWSEIVTRQMVGGNRVPLRGGQLIIEKALSPSSSLEDPGLHHPQLIQSEHTPYAAYAFGRQYNRLLRPTDSFEYLSLLLEKDFHTSHDPWVRVLQACGAQTDILESARQSMADACRRSDAEVQNNSDWNMENPGIEVRQVSGSPGSPGLEKGRIWIPSLEPTPPEGPTILVLNRWDYHYYEHLKRSVGLIERYGGRGGAGDFLSRQLMKPSVSEVIEAPLLRNRMSAVLDGDAGIVTLTEGIVY